MYARPEVVLFLERLGKQYREACGEPLVVTSLTRPKSSQPHSRTAVKPQSRNALLTHSRTAALLATQKSRSGRPAW